MKKIFVFSIVFCGLTAFAQQPSDTVTPAKYDKIEHLTTLISLEKEKTLNLQASALQKKL